MALFGLNCESDSSPAAFANLAPRPHSDGADESHADTWHLVRTSLTPTRGTSSTQWRCGRGKTARWPCGRGSTARWSCGRGKTERWPCGREARNSQVLASQLVRAAIFASTAGRKPFSLICSGTMPLPKIRNFTTSWNWWDTRK